MSVPTPITKIAQPKLGLAFWMDRVLEECDRAAANFAPDPVHDLRVALRRCRSMADGLIGIDPDPGWKQMKKAGKQLFGRLGELRDVQVMEEWVHHFDCPGDPATHKLLAFLALRETQLKHEAAEALQQFDRKQWRKWSAGLPRRAARLRLGSPIFKHLALERWQSARQLHSRALRNRSQIAFHSLRIGLKRFRYIVENFLPEQHAAWSDDLKELQDLLGEVHDLDVLWVTAQQVDAFPDEEARSRWHGKIQEARDQRLEKYRSKTLGKTGLWYVWREGLPQGSQIEAAAMQRLKFWAAALDPDIHHANRVARLALQLYDGLVAAGRIPRETAGSPREILRLAALFHDVGRSQHEKGHHKTSYRLVHRLMPPLGIDPQSLRMAAAVARYHRGALPHAGQKALQVISQSDRRIILLLGGILRLANSFDATREGRIPHLEVSQRNGFVVVSAHGYSARDRLAEEIAAARHLLETVVRCPVMVKPLAPRS